MKPPTDLALWLATIVGICGIGLLVSSINALVRRSSTRLVTGMLVVCVTLGAAFVGLAVYMASWGFVTPHK